MSKHDRSIVSPCHFKIDEERKIADWCSKTDKNQRLNTAKYVHEYIWSYDEYDEEIGHWLFQTDQNIAKSK